MRTLLCAILVNMDLDEYLYGKIQFDFKPQLINFDSNAIKGLFILFEGSQELIKPV